jgi:nitroimidazol reductase NimA-like FMN-containing flavoprotein (pyridoxamine 5'-phosphate oxidase superfamily)
MPNYPSTSRNRVRRLPRRAHYDRDTVHAILDEGLVAHVGLLDEGAPVVIPMLYARQGDTILLHGAATSRLLKHVGRGQPVSVAVTLIDGIVFARSVFHHSMNYRSVVAFGAGRLLTESDEKLEALEAFTEHIARGRWADVRPPNRLELKATSVVAVDIESAAAKIRTGPPLDEEEDYALPCWAGVLPLVQRAGAPIADPRLEGDPAIPPYVAGYRRG